MKTHLLSPASAILLAILVCIGAIVAFDSGRPGHAEAAAPCSISGVRAEFASTILSQVPVGVTVTHKARVRSGNCDLSGVTFTIVPPGGQTLVSMGNTGAWSCTANTDQSLTCTRDAMAHWIVSTLTLTYQQGPYQDSPSPLHGCVTAEDPALERCSQAYFKALP